VKCLNPACGSPEANELNVSANISETEIALEKEYSGTTEYGDTSNTIATVCPTCEMTCFVHNWQELVLGWLRPPTGLDFVMVLPEPRWCAACLMEDESQVHADYADKWASKWDTSALMCEQHALKHALKGEPIVLWKELTA
jgi:hypothetical protein